MFASYIKSNTLFIFLVICTAIVCAPFFSGCHRPSYPKEKLESDIKELVDKEYGYDIKVRVVGKTLGLFMPISQILNYDNSVAESFGQKSQDIFLSAARAVLSTDADLDFFITKYTDEVKGLEISMIRSVLDTKKLLLGAISRNDYYERTVFEYKYDIEKFAEKTVRKLFQDIPVKKSAVSSYFFMDKDKPFGESFLFTYIMESEIKDNISYSILSVKHKRIDEEQCLIYVKTRESYTPKAGYDAYQFSFQSGYTHEFLFSVKIIKGILPVISDVYIYTERKDGQTITPAMPPLFSAHADISSWDNYFYLRDIKLTDFIIEQAASKINRKINEADNPKVEKREDDTEFLTDTSNVMSTEGKFTQTQTTEGESSNEFHLLFRFKDNAGSKKLSDEFTNSVLKFFKRVLSKYEYTDYKQLVLYSSDGEIINSFDKSIIDNLQLEDISLKGILKPSQY